MARTADELLHDYGVDPDHVTEARNLILDATIRAHIPSLTDEDERRIIDNILGADSEAADLALRTCACGEDIDGFYQYVDHLIAVFGGESHYGG